MLITNFGGNVAFTPKAYYTPKSAEEVLAILNKHKGGTIRVVSSLHCWSDAVVSNDVIINLKHLNAIEIKRENGEVSVRAGGGVVLRDLLRYLRAHANCTLPTMGGIMRQTIAGVVSTATHGTGKSSISHYIDEIRVAAYDERSGEAKVYRFTEGEGLKAARCALGCMGVILSVTFRALPNYWVKEQGAFCSTIQETMRREQEFPLQQFMLIPYSWRYFTHSRAVCGKPNAGMRAWSFLLRVYDFLNVELGLHLLLKCLIGLFSQTGKPSSVIRWFYQSFAPRALHQPTIVNEAVAALTLHTSHHYYFRHVEMEAFVLKSRVEEAAEMIRYVTAIFAGTDAQEQSNVASKLKEAGLYEEVERGRGTYMHHYPFFFRRVLPDDALISMTAGDAEPRYSISFFTYLAPSSRDGFWNYTRVIARALVSLCGARLHWGKYFPLTHKDIADLYPRLAEFRHICKRVDPRGVFVNAYAWEVMGF